MPKSVYTAVRREVTLVVTNASAGSPGMPSGRSAPLRGRSIATQLPTVIESRTESRAITRRFAGSGTVAMPITTFAGSPPTV